MREAQLSESLHPQSPTKAQIDAVAAAAREIRRIRTDALESIKGGLRALYRTLELPGQNPLKSAHATLDNAVLAAYGFDPKADLLAQLLSLNLTVSTTEKAGGQVTAPGVPPSRRLGGGRVRPRPAGRGPAEAATVHLGARSLCSTAGGLAASLRHAGQDQGRLSFF